MLLSIIVPVYNVETYLEKCVNSLLNQDLDLGEYEIILVDDGSMDSSGRLCDELCALSANIRTIHQPNGGLGSARNTGIAVASGKYIQLVDSDDYLTPNVLGEILTQLENQDLDILRINYQNVDETGKVFEPNRYSKPFVDYSQEVCDGAIFLNERLGFACYAVQFVIKSSILRQQENAFKSGIFFEDVEWTPRVLLKANRVASNPLIAYNYLYRTESITRTSDRQKRQKKLSDQLFLIDALILQAKNTRDSRWFEGMIAQIALSILNSVSRYFYPERKSFIKELKDKQIFPLSTFHATPAARRKIRILNIHPALGCWLFHLKSRNR